MELSLVLIFMLLTSVLAFDDYDGDISETRGHHKKKRRPIIIQQHVVESSSPCGSEGFSRTLNEYDGESEKGALALAGGAAAVGYFVGKKKGSGPVIHNNIYNTYSSPPCHSSYPTHEGGIIDTHQPSGHPIQLPSPQGVLSNHPILSQYLTNLVGGSGPRNTYNIDRAYRQLNRNVFRTAMRWFR